MSSNFIFSETRGRGLLALDRGYRTPDPSPTRDASNLPACTPKEFFMKLPRLSMPSFESPVEGDDATPRGNYDGSTSGVGYNHTPTPSQMSTPRGNSSEMPSAPQAHLEPLSLQDLSAPPCDFDRISSYGDTPTPSQMNTPRGNFTEMPAAPPQAYLSLQCLSAPPADFNRISLYEDAQSPSQISTPRSNFAEMPKARLQACPQGMSAPLGNFSSEMSAPRLNLTEMLPQASSAHGMSAPPGSFSSLPYRTPCLSYENDYEDMPLMVEKPSLPQSLPLPVGWVPPPPMAGGYPARDSKKQNSRYRNQATSAANTVSIGSVGHPNACGAACKYVWKARGCKDGPNCDRCHLCTWYRR